MAERIISLLTDFGTQDGFVGVMKGVIWKIAPGTAIADVSHEIEAQNILHGALILGQSYRYFPDESIHVGVVDPGVGTSRQAIALRIGKYFFVGPDNGLLTIPIQDGLRNGETIQAVVLDKPGYWLEAVSASFHGRDIFAPAAAHLARGTAIEALGSAMEGTPTCLEIPKAIRTDFGWRCQVLMADRFGNLITNLSQDETGGAGIGEVRCVEAVCDTFVRTFGEGHPGQLVTMFDSSGRLSLCVVGGSARERVKAKTGQTIEVYLVEAGDFPG